MPQATPLETVSSATAPGPPADWRVAAAGNRLRFTSVADGSGLTVNSGGRLAHSAGAETRWKLVPATGCTAFPEIEVNATGTPFTGASPTAPVRGFLDSAPTSAPSTSSAGGSTAGDRGVRTA
jgi:hypothetical protein